MNSKDFKALRKFNRITAKRLGSIMNYDDQTIYYFERLDEELPEIFLIALGKLLNKNLQDINCANELISKIPQRFYNRTNKKVNHGFSNIFRL